MQMELEACHAASEDGVGNVNTRFHMIESEMRGIWKKLKDSGGWRSYCRSGAALPATLLVCQPCCLQTTHWATLEEDVIEVYIGLCISGR